MLLIYSKAIPTMGITSDPVFVSVRDIVVEGSTVIMIGTEVP